MRFSGYQPGTALDVDRLVDTNVLIDVVAGRLEKNPNQTWAVPSVVLQEFLKMQKPDGGYTWMPPGRPQTRLGNPEAFYRRHPPRSRRFVMPKSVDSFVLDFGNFARSRIEAGHRVVTAMFEGASASPVESLARQAGGSFAKNVRSNYVSAHENTIGVVPLVEPAAALGLQFFRDFAESHNAKTNQRNSLDDMFILATALRSGQTLVSNDKLMKTFATEIGLPVFEASVGTFTVTTVASLEKSDFLTKESKGYVNVPWQVRAHRN